MTTCGCRKSQQACGPKCGCDAEGCLNPFSSRKEEDHEAAYQGDLARAHALIKAQEVKKESRQIIDSDVD